MAAHFWLAQQDRFCYRLPENGQLLSLANMNRRDISKAAQALGRLAAGKPKRLSPEEIRRRTERIKQAKRWPKKTKGKK